MKIREGGDLLSCIFSLYAKETLTMKLAILLIRTTMAAICVIIPALFIPLILGFVRMQKSSLAEELVLSEAERRLFNL